MLTLPPYKTLKSYCADTKLNILLIYRHAHGIESTYINAANSHYATKRSTHMILLLYTSLNFNYTSTVLSLDHWLSKDTRSSAHCDLQKKNSNYISHKLIYANSSVDGGLPCNIKVYHVTLKLGTPIVIISNYFLFLHIYFFFSIESK